MRKFIALFIFAAAFLQAQNHRFIYEYKFVCRFYSKDHSTSEMMFLDITKMDLNTIAEKFMYKIP